MKKVVNIFMAALCFWLSWSPHLRAEPVSPNPVYVISIRPYINGAIFVEVSSKELCNSEVFLISETAPGKKEMYSAVLVAFATSKRVRLEALTATGCTGWGTQLQSIYLDLN